MGLDRAIDITGEQRGTILALLERHLPDTEAWVYGSRIKWTSRPQSDLDLVVFATQERQRQIDALREAFEKSDLPFRVDLFVWDDVPESFQVQIDAEHVVLVDGTGDHHLDGQHLKSIDDVCSRVTSGGTPSRRNTSFYEGGPWPWLKTQELQDGWLDDSEEHITDHAVASSSAKVLPENTILMAMYGATVGQLGILRRPMTCNQACCAMIVDPAQADYRYLFYKLLHARQRIKSLSTGAAQQNLSGQLIKSLKFSFPSLSEQRAIVHILGTLDDKIELNRRMNETLEAMARALFKSWFVDFDPVRAKMEGRDTGLPKHLAGLFPDRLVESELGEIPEGWEVESLEMIAQLEKATVKPEDHATEEFEHFSLPAYDSGQLPALDLGSTIKSNKTLVPSQAVLLSKLNPEIQRVWLPASASSRRQISSTEFLVFTPKPPIGRAGLYALFNTQSFRDLLKGMVTGTSKSHQRVAPKSLVTQGMISPADILTNEFEALAWPMLERTLRNKSENHTLAALRDTLLPKLISGELRAKQVEAIA